MYYKTKMITTTMLLQAAVIAAICAYCSCSTVLPGIKQGKATGSGQCPLKVTLRVYSGGHDPSWTVQPHHPLFQDVKFHLKTQTATPLPHILGYRGIEVQNDDSVAQMVAVGSNYKLEELLLYTGLCSGDPETVSLVQELLCELTNDAEFCGPGLSLVIPVTSPPEVPVPTLEPSKITSPTATTFVSTSTSIATSASSPTSETSPSTSSTISSSTLTPKITITVPPSPSSHTSHATPSASTKPPSSMSTKPSSSITPPASSSTSSTTTPSTSSSTMSPTSSTNTHSTSSSSTSSASSRTTSSTPSSTTSSKPSTATSSTPSTTTSFTSSTTTSSASSTTASPTTSTSTSSTSSTRTPSTSSTATSSAPSTTTSPTTSTTTSSTSSTSTPSTSSTTTSSTSSTTTPCVTRSTPVSPPTPTQTTTKKPCRCPKYQPDKWNNNQNTRENNNCYNYATNSKTGTFAQPGRGSGCTYGSLTGPAVKSAAESDGLEDQGNPGAGMFPETDDCLVALVIWPGRDFHWYRQDKNGNWSHKPGETPATNLDNSGNVITDPRTADLGPYQFVCFMSYCPDDITVNR